MLPSSGRGRGRGRGTSTTASAGHSGKGAVPGNLMALVGGFQQGNSLSRPAIRSAASIETKEPDASVSAPMQNSVAPPRPQASLSNSAVPHGLPSKAHPFPKLGSPVEMHTPLNEPQQLDAGEGRGEAEHVEVSPEEQAGDGSECSICLETVHRSSRIWPCRQCHAVFHLACAQQWAQNGLSSAATAPYAVISFRKKQWRCPNCREAYSEKEYPSQYLCWCGKTVNPSDDPWLEPHSCGEMCQKPKTHCAHKCPRQCHPGKCAKSHHSLLLCHLHSLYLAMCPRLLRPVPSDRHGLVPLRKIEGNAALQPTQLCLLPDLR